MNTKSQPIDLTKYFNALLDDEIHHKPGNDLKAVPHGVSQLAGATFDVKGLIQLSGSISKEKTGQDYPASVTGIGIQRKGGQLHFLHGASWHDQAGTKIGEYRIHHANGQMSVIPIVYQVHVVDWWMAPTDPAPTQAEVAWRGDNERTRERGYFIQLYKQTWTNPFPAVAMTTIDFVSQGAESAPFLMAITVE